MSKKFYLVTAGVSVVLAFAVLYFVHSGLYRSLGKFEGLFMVAGILLILMSFFFARKAYVDRELSRKARLLIVFGPAISGGSAGLSGISMGVASEGLWWVPLVLALLSFVSFQVAFIVAVLLARQLPENSE